MNLLQVIQSFDWKTLLLGEEDWSFLPEVILRSVIMFIVAIIAIRLIGKRGIMQGVFEIVTIITLGSAAGDPMFYKKVGVLPAILVFITIILLYRIINYLLSKFKWFEHVVEGRHVRLIKESRFAVENFGSNELSKDEILSDLRLKGVAHLGQVDSAYIEPSGEMSIFFLPDNKVGYGLPVIPEKYEVQLVRISERATYSCAFCGYTEEIKPASAHTCIICRKKEWVRSSDDKRIK